MNFKNIYLLNFILLFCNCSIEYKRYEAAYKKVQAKYDIDSVSSIKYFDFDISGVYVYDSIYPLPYIKHNEDSIINLNNEKIRKPLLYCNKPLNRNRQLTKLSRENHNPIWLPLESYKDESLFFKGLFKGPQYVAIFSEIKNNQLRVDIIGPRWFPSYSGSVFMHYFKFKGTKIVDSLKWVNHVN